MVMINSTLLPPCVLQLNLWNSLPYEPEIGRRICDRILWPDPDQSVLVPRIVTNFPVKSSPTLLDTTTASLSMLYRNHHHSRHYLFTSRFMSVVDCCVWTVRDLGAAFVMSVICCLLSLGSLDERLLCCVFWEQPVAVRSGKNFIIGPCTSPW